MIIILSSLPVGVFAEGSWMMDRIGDFLSPFWEIPEKEETFEFVLRIPVSNDGTIQTTPVWKIFLMKEDGSPLMNLDAPIIDSFGTRRIQDHLTLNPENIVLMPGQETVFSVVWHGFVDQYITDGMPVVEYHHPGEVLGIRDDDVHFWEKLVSRTDSISLLARVELGYVTEFGVDASFQDQTIPIQITYDRLVAVPNTGLLIIFALLAGIVCGLIFTRDSKPHHGEKLRGKSLNFETFETLALEISEQPIKKPKRNTKTPNRSKWKKTTQKRKNTEEKADISTRSSWSKRTWWVKKSSTTSKKTTSTTSKKKTPKT